MNVANLQLSKELYELSGWNDLDAPSEYSEARQFQYSQYTLGYLLRKLPKSLIEKDGSYRAGRPRLLTIKATYKVLNIEPSWMGGYGKAFKQEAHTPEDCAAKLAIELFKQGILKKEQS